MWHEQLRFLRCCFVFALMLLNYGLLFARFMFFISCFPIFVNARHRMPASILAKFGGLSFHCYLIVL